MATGRWLIQPALSGFFVYSETVVRPFSHQPDDVISAAKYPLPFFAQKGELAVGQVVAYLLPSFHAEGHETVSLLAKAQREGMLEFVGIKAGGGFVAWNNEIRCIGMLFYFQ